MKFWYETTLDTGRPGTVRIHVDMPITDPRDVVFALELLERLITLDRDRAFQALGQEPRNAAAPGEGE